MNNTVPQNFDFGNGVKFRLDADFNGRVLDDFEIRISIEDFGNVMKNVLSQDEISSVLESYSFQTDNSLAEDILNGYVVFSQRDYYWNEESLLRASNILDQFSCYMDKEGSEYDIIKKACQKVYNLAEEELKRIRNKKKSKKLRSEISNNYVDIFMFLGKRDGFHCQYCETTKDLVIDHIYPLIKGGDNDEDNLQLLCSTCNSKKRDKI